MRTTVVIKEFATPIGLIYGLAALLYVHLALWTLSHHQSLYDPVIGTLTAQTALVENVRWFPKRVLTPVDMRLAIESGRGPTLSELYFLNPPDDFLWLPVVIPFTNSGQIELEGDRVTANLPILLPCTVLIVFLILIRPLRSDRAFRDIDSVLADSIKALMILLPLPVVMAYFLLYYSELPSMTGVALVTRWGAGTRTLFILFVLLLCIYPLVFLHLRWCRSTRCSGANAEPMHCNRCGYPLDELPRCPECGSDRGSDSKGRLSRGRRRVLMFGYSAVPIILVAPFWLSWIDIGFAWLQSAI